MDCLGHYSNPSHALSVLCILNQQRLRGQMCDVVLVVGNQKYQAHKSVLAASSEYFQSIFIRMGSESPKVINLDFCEPDAFEIVLNYIYTTSLLVDKGSLAAIQELGYSLGIPFLTNIVSTRPNISYSVSKKMLSFSEGDKDDVQTRSVIVSRVQNDAANSSRSSHHGKSLEKTSPPLFINNPASLPSEPNLLVKNSKPSGKTPERGEAPAKASYMYATMLKDKSHVSFSRPQLTSSVSFSDAEVPQLSLQSGTELDSKEKHKVPLQGPPNEQGRTIDRSGPLIKSLLRRSLSMDSPVPAFSPTLELKELQNREQSVVKIASKTTVAELSAYNGKPIRNTPPVLTPELPIYIDKETQVTNVTLKIEPSSPLPDPMDIVRITVGKALPISLHDLQFGMDKKIKGKRKAKTDNQRSLIKKSKQSKVVFSLSNVNRSEAAPQQGGATEEEIFKCWTCLKVLRSKTGLRRHVNMYHNPEKPYVCDICHKRFHTNFKVWTHYQTQHGVVQNPATSSSVTDERYQKKGIDVIREKELKKAVAWKLRKNKLSSQSLSPTKKRSKPNFTCPYCGKVFVFQSHYRQHVKTHPAENQNAARENLNYQQEIPHQETPGSKIYCCRLCNSRLSSLKELADHEKRCKYATVCPYCGLCFSSAEVKTEHEVHCKYKKLTCLDCMKSFKSSFSVWRHQIEVHNLDMITVLGPPELEKQGNRTQGPEIARKEPLRVAPAGAGSSREGIANSNSSGPQMYNSEGEPVAYVPENPNEGNAEKVVVKEEPLEEAVSDRAEASRAEEPGVWPCANCSKLFSCRKDMERHQELLCHIKPFNCHICKKAFRTNFRLWSHFQSHMATACEAAVKEMERQPSSGSPSPPPLQVSEYQTRSPEIPVLGRIEPRIIVRTEEYDSRNPVNSGSEASNANQTEVEPGDPCFLSRSSSLRDPDTFFYHTPHFTGFPFKRKHMCKLCHRTFKTPFSLWSHEQSHLQDHI